MQVSCVRLDQPVWLVNRQQAFQQRALSTGRLNKHSCLEGGVNNEHTSRKYTHTWVVPLSVEGFLMEM